MTSENAQHDQIERSEAPCGWQFAIDENDVPSAGTVEVVFGNTVILLLRDGDDFAAVQGLCPHGWARLNEGRVEDGWLHCPRHQAKFRLDDGSCGPGWELPPLKRYATKRDRGRVLVPDPLIPTD